MTAQTVARSLYRRTLKLAAALDDSGTNPAKRALLMGIPKKVWHEETQTAIGIRYPKGSYHGLVSKFTKGEHFKPAGQMAVDHVRAAWRAPGGSVTLAFQAMREMKLVLEAGAKLPRFKKQTVKKTLKISTGRRAHGTGKLLVGHPLAFLLKPLLHRSVILTLPETDDETGQPRINGLVLNKPSGKTLSECVHSSWGGQFGPLLNYEVLLGGDKGGSIYVLHPWENISGSIELSPGLHMLDLMQILTAENGSIGLEQLKEKVSSHPGTSAPIRVLYNCLSWDPLEVQTSLINNHWVSLEPRGGKRRKATSHHICLNNLSWQFALRSCSGDASILSAIPELTSNFGDCFKPIAEAHHKLIQTHVNRRLTKQLGRDSRR